MRTLLAVALGLMVTVQTAQGAGDPAAGKAKSAACGACHGADGNSTNPEWPKLAGQHGDYLLKQLQEYKSGERVNATMNGMAAGLSEVDMADLAAFYSAQTKAPGAADPNLVELGQRIYRGGNLESGVAACMGCHGPAGEGNPMAGFPTLAGQHAQYTELTLHAFRKAERKNDPNLMMRRIALRMTDDEIRAVAGYLAGLHR